MQWTTVLVEHVPKSNLSVCVCLMDWWKWIVKLEFRSALVSTILVISSSHCVVFRALKYLLK